MSIRQIAISLCFPLFCAPAAAQTVQPEDTIAKCVRNWMGNWQRPDMHTSTPRVDSVRVDAAARTILVQGSGGFEEQFFTEESVERAYRELKAALPKEQQNYKLTIRAYDKEISELIPNAVRSGKKDQSRLWDRHYKGDPWVKNASRAFEAKSGLENTHIALWQSHGRYWDTKENQWKWQRPRLFCTCEDLFSQTFVVPFIIPMLENAGAIVWTPRERDWQPNMALVDNDNPQAGGTYSEGHVSDASQPWTTAPQAGFALGSEPYNAMTMPFQQGTARCVQATAHATQVSYAQWMPDIPEAGRYAVYVSYQTLPNSVSDARYVVHHKGGTTAFRVNQQMGGGTWVYLGTFDFDAGQNQSGRVVLTNQSDHAGTVSADAVRFGSGMGNIQRSLSRLSGATSDLPRFAEAARYSAQWAGFADSTFDAYEGANDYNADIQVRGRATNELAGGSIYMPNLPGRKVPLELAVAFHTDAGVSSIDNLIGSLAIATTRTNDGLTDAGISRYANYDLASLLISDLSRDLAKYGWSVRKVWNRNYGETRIPQVPAAIFEMLSHQNFADMKLGHDPHFKFDLSRSAYKTIVKYVAQMHQRSYVIQPLPVKDFAISIDERHSTASLSWSGVDDPLEPTARPTGYVLYQRTADGGFDNGTPIDKDHCTVQLERDKIYSFRVCATNDGGQSFPSETLCAYISSNSQGKALIVNAFTRLSAPATLENDSLQGFLLDDDPGVPYGAFAGFCGRQLGFSRSRIGSEASDGLGASGDELEGKVVMGNTFDYPYLHGQGIALSKRFSFCSASVSAFLSMPADERNSYRMLDLIGGVQTDFPAQLSSALENYCQQGGNLLVSGANTLKSNALSVPSLHATMAETVSNPYTNQVHGCGLEFSICRGLNSTSYAVPQPMSLTPSGGAFDMLAYSTNLSAATAYSGSDCKAITLGFPLESIREPEQRNQLMNAIVNFLCP